MMITYQSMKKKVISNLMFENISETDMSCNFFFNDICECLHLKPGNFYISSTEF